MADSDHEQIADRLEEESDALERHGDELRHDIEHARDEWERKRADAGVPGAPQPDTGGEEPEAEFPAKAESAEDEG